MAILYGPAGDTEDTITVSIIIPCYKVEKYLPKCLDSLLKQTQPNIEIICINDGSPDSCIDILTSYQQEHSNIVIIDKENEGTWKGRRDGIAIARGEYIGFLDSDDYAEPDFIGSLYAAAKSSDADIAVCGFYREDLLTGKVLSSEMISPRPAFAIGEDPGRLLELNGAPWNKIFKSSYLKGMIDLEPAPPIFDDLMFHLLAYAKMAGTVVFVPKPLIHYMVRSDSLINTVREEQIDATHAAFLKVRDLYHAGSSPEMVTMLDSMAFLHFGISLMFRLSANKEHDLRRLIEENTSFLDRYFPLWRKSPYITWAYASQEQGIYTRLWAAHKLYKAHLMRPSLAFYRWMICTLKVDIKW